jgi:hypothetical protein
MTECKDIGGALCTNVIACYRFIMRGFSFPNVTGSRKTSETDLDIAEQLNDSQFPRFKQLLLGVAMSYYEMKYPELREFKKV